MAELFQHEVNAWVIRETYSRREGDEVAVMLGRCTVASEEQWRAVAGWEKTAAALTQLSANAGKLADQIDRAAAAHVDAASELPLMERPFDAPVIKGMHARPRVRLNDIFKEWDGPVFDSGGHVIGTTSGNGLPAAQWLPILDPKDGAYTCCRTLSEIRQRVYRDVIDACPNLDFVVVTEHPERVRELWDGHRQNVILLAHITTQQEADERIPELLRCSDLCTGGVFCEPVEEIDLKDLPAKGGWRVDSLNGWWFIEQQCGPDEFQMGQQEQGPGLRWVVCSGEPHLQLEWSRSLRDQCQYANVPFWCEELQEYGVPG